MDDETAEAFEIYCKRINYWPSNGCELDDQLEGFQESYQGFFGGSGKDAALEYTYQYVEDTGLLSGVPVTLERYFDQYVIDYVRELRLNNNLLMEDIASILEPRKHLSVMLKVPIIEPNTILNILKSCSIISICLPGTFYQKRHGNSWIILGRKAL